jgi:hypothetical protein
MMKRFALCLALATLLTACADHTPQSIRDLESCRRSAERSMGPDVALSPEDIHNNSPMVMAKREQIQGQYQTMVDQCMGNPR